MVKDYLNQINGRLTSDVNMFTGGINTYMDKAFIESEQMPFVINMTMFRPPMMCTRPFRMSLASYFENGQYPFDDKNIVDMWYNEEFGLYVITSVKEEPSDEEPQPEIRTAYLEHWDLKQGTIEPLGSLGTLAKPYYFCHCWQSETNYLYITTGFSKYKVTLGTNPIFEPLLDGPSGIPAFHKGRLFFANPATKIVTFSALYDFDTFEEFPNMSAPTTLTNAVAITDGSSSIWLTTGCYNTGEYNLTLNGGELLPNDRTFYYDSSAVAFTFDVGTQLVYNSTTTEWETKMYDYSSYSGDFKVTNAVGDIVGMRSFDDKLYIFCEESMHLLYGTTPDTTSSYQFQLVDLNNGIGAFANRAIAVGGNRLFWLGTDHQVYMHTGSSLYMISRPTESNSGGIDNIFIGKYIGGYKYDNFTGVQPQMCATASRMFLNIKTDGSNYNMNNITFVYDIYNKIWWAEDGEFTSICSPDGGSSYNLLFMAKTNGDILYSTTVGVNDDNDEIYNFDERTITSVPIKYQFQTRIYGADGVDSRKTLSSVWLQSKATADVYLGDLWTAVNHWELPILSEEQLEGYIKLGELKYVTQPKTAPTEYTTDFSEQHQLIVPKMYGQRTNAFSIFVSGEGRSEFYLMKRKWSAR